MNAEAFEGNKWVVATGVQPVDDDTLVDVKWSDGDLFLNRPAIQISWYISDVVNVTHWRLHKEDKYLEDAYDSNLPKVVCNVPMPHCKPAKQEKHGKLTDDDILRAFNKLTGNNVSYDEYETLLSLQEMFDGRD